MSNSTWMGKSKTATETTWAGGQLTFNSANAWSLQKFCVTTLIIGSESSLTDSDGTFKVVAYHDYQDGDDDDAVQVVLGSIVPGDSITLDSRETFFIKFLRVYPLRSDGVTADTAAEMNYHLQAHTSASRATV